MTLLSDLTDDELLLEVKQLPMGYLPPIMYEVLKRFETAISDMAMLVTERDMLADKLKEGV